MNEHKDKLPPINNIQETGDTDLQPALGVREIDAISRRFETIAHTRQLTDPEAHKIAAIALRQAGDISKRKLTIDDIQGTQPEHLISK